MTVESTLIFDVKAGRRAFIAALGLGLSGAMLLGQQRAQSQALTDADIMNFALNFE